MSSDQKEELAAIRTAVRKVDKDFGKKPAQNDGANKKKKKSRKEKKLAREIKALKATMAEREEEISAMRSAGNCTQPTASNPLERPTQRATINGRAATLFFG